MEIKEIKNKYYPKDYLRIEMSLGNICNYKCWYCFPGSHEGDIKWPDFDILKKNLSHLLDYYIEHGGKKRFNIDLLGGEITHWKNFIPFIKYFKEKYNCIFSLTTNGSKKIQWWEEASNYLAQVTISNHLEFSKKEHLRDVADLLYRKKVLVEIDVLMDPFRWQECLDVIDFYKKSKKRWTIKVVPIVHETVKYTQEQNDFLSKVRIRSNSILRFLLLNKTHRNNPYVIDTNNKRHKINDYFIIINRLNNFLGWECSLGVTWISVRFNGDVEGTCGNKLFAQNKTYNIFKEDFIENFRPQIQPTICTVGSCWCAFETTMDKKKTMQSKKIIPIYEN